MKKMVTKLILNEKITANQRVNERNDEIADFGWKKRWQWIFLMKTKHSLVDTLFKCCVEVKQRESNYKTEETFFIKI